MFCPNCGSNAPDTERFCPTCGTALNGGNAAPAAPAGNSNDIVALIKSKWPIFLAAAAAVVVVIVLLGSLLLGGGAKGAAKKYMKNYLNLEYEKADNSCLIPYEEYLDYKAKASGVKFDDYLVNNYKADDMEEYFENYMNDEDDQTCDDYGSNWKVSCKVLATADLTNDEWDTLEDFLKWAEEADLIEDEGAYEKACKVYVQNKIKGEEDMTYSVSEVWLVKDGMSWKIVDPDMMSGYDRLEYHRSWYEE